MNAPLREVKLHQLTHYYQENGISCDNFNCNHILRCTELANGRPLMNGAEAHLGTHYGEIAKILVLSLDTGGDAENINVRTEKIEAIVYETENQHMKGTIDILFDLFSNYHLNKIDVLKHFSMTNAAKCSAADNNADKLP